MRYCKYNVRMVGWGEVRRREREEEEGWGVGGEKEGIFCSVGLEGGRGGSPAR